MEAKYCAFDVETTGLQTHCNLLTVCFVMLDRNLEKLDSLNISLKQENGYYVFPEAMGVNKIDIVKHHSTSMDLINARQILHSFIKKYKKQYALITIGHNVSFDIKFILASGLLTESEYYRSFGRNPIDTLTIAQFLKVCGTIPEKQSLSLTHLCKTYKLTKNENLQHSAEYDTNMTIDLLKYFRSMTNGEVKPETKKRKTN